jgi:hypothetical protein
VVIEESDESPFWLEIIVESNLLPKERLTDLLQEASELIAIFIASRKTASTNLKSSI